MRQVLLKIAVLLGLVFCTSLYHGGASAEVRIPDDGVTIILRAPLHNLHLVKQVRGKPDEIVSGLEVSLPKGTPIFFKVDQVNTVLYKVQITVTEEPPEQETGMEIWQRAFQMLFASLSEQPPNLFSSGDRNSNGTDNDLVQQVVERLKHKTQQVKELEKELDAYLQRTEKRQFYTGTAAKVKAGFKKINTDAKEAAKKILGLPSGTSDEILADAKNTHQEICRKLSKQEAGASSVSKESFDTTMGRFKTALAEVAAKLENIENATWQQEDIQFRILKNKLKFTCVITPIASDTEEDSSKRREFEVILSPEGWGILISPLPAIIVSNLRDASYVVREKKGTRGKMTERANAENMPGGGEIPGNATIPAAAGLLAVDGDMQDDAVQPVEPDMPADAAQPAGDENMPASDEMPLKFIARRGSEDDYTISGGALIHICRPDKSGPLALSGGVAVDGNKNLQVALGVSLLFRTGKEQLVAFTMGTIVGKVKRLDGYKVGDLFTDDTPPTKFVYRRGYFGALTYNFKFDSLFGSGQPGNSTN